MSKSEDAHFRLRLPADLKAAIEKTARESNRTINSEVLHRLNGWGNEYVSRGMLSFQLEAAERKVEKLERELQSRSMDDLARNLEFGLPPALFDRLEQSAATSGRTIEQELIAALEKAYPPPPPFSLDWFRSEWLTKIAAAPIDQKEALIDEANTVLAQNGGFFEIGYETSHPALGLEGEVVLTFKNREDRDPNAEYGPVGK